MTRSKSNTWAPPQEFAEYRIVRVLGAGAMGKVYLAHDTVLDRPVALKFLGTRDLDGVSRDRFLIEARALARLQHPNVLAVYRVGELGRRPYLVSEFVHGESLDKIPKPIEWSRVLELAIGLSRGLAAAHRRGVLHRDIKPANAILTDEHEVKLLDFGLAKFTDRVLVGVPGATPVNKFDDSDATELSPVGERTLPLPAVPAQSPVPVELGGNPRATPSPLGAIDASNETLPEEGTEVTEHQADSSPLSAPSLTRAGALMGTPYYMAPEIWRAEPASERSDIYSLGVLLFELLVGRPPHRSPAIAELAMIVQDNDAPPLARAVAGIDPKFAAIVDRCLQREALARYASADELRAALEAVREPTRAIIPEGNPYPGLHPFEANKAALFFGRATEARAVIERMRTDALVVVVGDPGVGKSSLCRAGVGPLIAAGVLGDSRVWRTTAMVPGRRPALALATCLSEALEIDLEVLETAISGDATARIEFRRDILRLLGNKRGLLLILDQIEELVTSPERAEASAVSTFLGELLATGGHGFRVLVTVRGDFLARAAQLEMLGDQLTRALFVLRPMSDDAVREAITEPAATQQVRIEPAALEQLVDAARSVGLALVQFALAELWLEKRENVLTAEALERLGGVVGALTRHADAAFTAMPPLERAEATRILLGLIRSDGTRVQRSRIELAVEDPIADRALEALIKGHLVAIRETDDELSYEIAHDALLRWERLRRWIDDDGELGIIRRRIEAGASEWVLQGRAKDLLWRDRRIGETTRVELDQLGETARVFVVTSRAAVRRRRIARLAIAIGVPLSILGAIVAVRFSLAAAEERRLREEQHQRDARVAGHGDEATALIARSQSPAKLRADREQAFALFDARDLANAEAAWNLVLQHSTALDTAYALASQELEHALVIDPQRDDVRARLAEILHLRAVLADEAHDNKQRTELIRRMTLYDTPGTYVARWTKVATLSLAVSPDTRLSIANVEVDGTRRLEREPIEIRGTTHEVSPGSYVVIARAGDREVRLPIAVRAGEQLPIALNVPTTIPKGFAYVPAGRFLVGTADERARRSFLSTVPLHVARTGPYLISKRETTFAEWLEFLDALPTSERDRHLPKSSSGAEISGRVAVEKRDGKWVLILQPTARQYVAREGEPVRYVDRATRSEQRWDRLPVIGVSLEDSRAFARWLDQTGRVPHARPCTEVEWERAARGADDREFPHGDVLRPDEANFDETYGKKPNAFGPDEVGSYPASRSPFAIDDMAGNAFEWVVPTLSTDQAAIRGGTFYFGALTARLTNRNTVEPTARSVQVGIRMCADVGE